MSDGSDYSARLAREGEHWGQHLKIESHELHAWLDHPRIVEHYRARGLIDSVAWEQWVTRRLGQPLARSMELGCGSAGRSLRLFEQRLSRWIDGVDVSPDRVALAQQSRVACQAPGIFQLGDANVLSLPPDTYDLIFSCHSFHHFTALEHVMAQVHEALTPRGVFVLEEYVGPTQFQWTDRQMAVVRGLMSLIPERLRRLRWGAVKTHEGRPTPDQVVAVSPFESIRSAEIVPLFNQRFDVVAVRPLGGTIQHLLYNGIIHNFALEDDEACRYLQAIVEVEDALIAAQALPSDFSLLIGQRRR